MKVLLWTKKCFCKDDVERLFGYDGYDTEYMTISEIKIPFESAIAKRNVERIKQDLMNDEIMLSKLLNIDFRYEDQVEELDMCPDLTYRDYLDIGIEFITKKENGKINKEIIVNDSLKRITTEYYITIAQLDIEDENMELVAYPKERLGGSFIWDYELLNEVAPNIVATLLKEGYVKICEMEVEE